MQTRHGLSGNVACKQIISDISWHLSVDNKSVDSFVFISRISHIALTKKKYECETRIECFCSLYYNYKHINFWDLKRSQLSAL